jgi:5-methylcytosine-specific restriction protein A
MTKAPRLTTLRPRVAMAGQRLTPRPKVKDHVYERADWRACIAGIIKQRGRRCENPSCKTPNHGAGQRIFGDHIQELSDGGALLDPRNIQLLCSSCHVSKTIAARKKRMETRW